MRNYLKFAPSIVAGALAISLVLAAGTSALPQRSTPATFDATVFVKVAGGHGSGVHLGNGLILTAAHVVEGETEVLIRYANSAMAPARVVGVNTEYDFAFVQTDYVGPAARWSCDPVKIGDSLVAVGSPYDIEFVTTQGTVAGRMQKLDHWPSVFTASINTGPGMSGGPVFNRSTGLLVGITVGGYRNTLGYSFTVPTSTICRLARGN